MMLYHAAYIHGIWWALVRDIFRLLMRYPNGLGPEGGRASAGRSPLGLGTAS